MMLPECFSQFKNNMQAFNLLHRNHIAIAVSGGADSIALLHLCNLLKQHTTCQFYVLCVNHKLRLEADAEVEFVASLCRKLDIPCRILEWKHNDSLQNLQAEARSARYQLMTEKCHMLGISHLLTAHHMDDMVETYMMRKEKDAGVFGLLPMKRNFLNNIQILRPLFNIPKIELVQYLQNITQEFCTDSSNFMTKYERARMRKTLQSDPNYPQLRHQIFTEQIALEQEAIKLQQEIGAILGQNTSVDPMGYATLNNAKEILRNHCTFYLLSHLITMIRGADRTPRGSSINTLHNNLLKSVGDINLRNSFTLHGTAINYQNDVISITREFGKTLPSDTAIDSAEINWDSRFTILPPSTHINKGYYVSHLSMQDFLSLRSNNISLPSKHILFTLPVIKKLEKLVAIPHIDYYDETERHNHYQIEFMPQFVSNITQFRNY